MTKIAIETSVGTIGVQLFADKAPRTTQFFLGLVDQGFYETSDIYRVSQLDNEHGPYLLQGGAALPFLQGKKASKRAPMLDQIETTGITGIIHRRGTFSLARDLASTGHALAEFFICLGDFSSLDENGRRSHDTKGFPAFGEVVLGLECLDTLIDMDRNGETSMPLLAGQMLTDTVKVKRIIRQ